MVLSDGRLAAGGAVLGASHGCEPDPSASYAAARAHADAPTAATDSVALSLHPRQTPTVRFEIDQSAIPASSPESLYDPARNGSDGADNSRSPPPGPRLLVLHNGPMGPGRVAVLISSLVLTGATSVLGQTAADGDPAIAAWIQQATQRMAVDEWDQAAALWSKVIAADSRHVVAHLNRAMSLYRAGECAARRADARQVLSLLDDGAVVAELERLVYGAQAHGHLLEFERAIELLEEASDRYPDSRPVSITLSLMRRRASGAFDWSCTEVPE